MESLRLPAGNGFRAGSVVDPGDFAVRGGIVDIFPPGFEAPVRLDYFGDTLESIRSFDPQSQRSTGTLKRIVLHPANEVLLTPDAIGRFRTAYAAAFGGLDIADPLYDSVSNGRRYQGMGLRCFTSASKPCSTICPMPPSRSITRRTRREQRAATR
jgi:transcription-repair coupling factor (superfamily II helicase)